MSSLALGGAFAAVQLVHQAYSKVKNSKARCARLVERCQLVVDRLERIAATKGGDAIIRERIHELERAFGHTALTIAQVGQQGIITSLLRSEANALRIESCNEVLTELISLFNLEELVDVRRWQSDLEVARARDHGELVSLGRRLESGNAAIHNELAQQGATIAEVLRVIHGINAGFQNAHSESTKGETLKGAIPLMSSNPSEGPSPTSCCQWRTRSATTGTIIPLPTPTSSNSASGTATSALCTCDSPRGPTATRFSKSATLRRLSFTLSKKCAKAVPPSTAFPKSTSSPPPFPSPSRSAAAAAAAVAATRDARDSPRTIASGRSAVIETRLLTVSAAADGDDDDDDGCTSSSPCSALPTPTDPPPPYQLRVINPTPECICSDGLGPATKPTSSSRFTTASVEAVRAPDSPVPTFPSPKLSTESVFGSTQSLASVASAAGDGTRTMIPGLRCDRRNSAVAVGSGPALRRKDTIGFARRATLPTGYPRVQPAM